MTLPALPSEYNQNWYPHYAAMDSVARGVVQGDLRVFGIYRPENYGGVGDGVANDTAAVQAAIDAVAGGPAGAEPTPQRQSKGKVLLTGTYLTTTAPLAKSILGLTIAGNGPRTSRIKVSGTRTNGITVIGCPNFILQDVGIIGDGYAGTAQVTNGVAFDWTPAQATSWGAQITLHRVHVEDLKFVNGFSFGQYSGSYDLSGVHAYDCLAAGNRALTSDDSTGLWQTGYLSGSGTAGNVLNHHFDQCNAVYVRRMFRQNSVNLVTMKDCSGSFLETAVYRSGQGITVYRGGRIEDSRRLAIATGGAGYAWDLTMEDIVWSPWESAATDRQIIQWYGPGNVRLRQIILEEASTGPADWLFRFDNFAQAVWQTNVVVDGVVCPNTTAESLISVPNQTKVFAEVRGLQAQTNAIGYTGTYVNRKTLVYNGATADSGTVTITT